MVILLVIGVTLATSFTAANTVPSSRAGASTQPIQPGEFPPTSTLTFPVNSTAYGNTVWNAGCASTICGTAHDSAGGSNILNVRVTILGPSGHYWNGTDFNTASSAQKFTATGATSWSLAFPASNFATAGGGDGSYTIKVYATDASGNIQAPPTTATITIDATAPVNSQTLTSQSPAGSSLKVGSTIYYRGTGGGSGGSFKIRNTVTDGGSGPASSTTAALGGTTTGWTHTPSTVSTPAGGPYDSNTFAWAEGTTSSPTEAMTGADVAGNTSVAATLTFTNDSAAPTGGALTVNSVAASGGGTSSQNNTGTFTIGTRTDYTDAGSGLASSTLTRQAAALSSGNGITPGSCGTFGTATVITGNPSQSLTGPSCYLFTLTGTDNVGNTTAVSTTVLVDTTAPSSPSDHALGCDRQHLHHRHHRLHQPASRQIGQLHRHGYLRRHRLRDRQAQLPRPHRLLGRRRRRHHLPLLERHLQLDGHGRRNRLTDSDRNQQDWPDHHQYVHEPTRHDRPLRRRVDGELGGSIRRGHLELERNRQLHDRHPNRLHRRRLWPRLLDPNPAVGNADCGHLRCLWHHDTDHGQPEPDADGAKLLPVHTHRHRQRRQHDRDLDNSDRSRTRRAAGVRGSTGRWGS